MVLTERRVFVVVDDHESVLSGTVGHLEKTYPNCQVFTAKNSQSAQITIRQVSPQLVITDLAIPEIAEGSAQTKIGIDLLRLLLQTYPALNVVVQSAHTQSLVQLKPTIDLHEAGFVVAEKRLSLESMLKRVEWALEGIVYLPSDIRSGLEVKPEWLEVLDLAFCSGLQDRAIAQKMNISERTVQNYWNKLQDALNAYPNEGENKRICIEISARKAGLLA